MPMPAIMSLISVAAGGAIGAGARYGVSLLLAPDARFPWPTLCVNVLGCFIAGIVGTWFLSRGQASPNLQLFLITGILGGFTTYSAFSLDTLRLAESGQVNLALLNIMTNVLGALLAVVCGWSLARTIMA